MVHVRHLFCNLKASESGKRIPCFHGRWHFEACLGRAVGGTSISRRSACEGSQAPLIEIGRHLGNRARTYAERYKWGCAELVASNCRITCITRRDPSSESVGPDATRLIIAAYILLCRYNVFRPLRSSGLYSPRQTCEYAVLSE
jgi:hypothetical protein